MKLGDILVIIGVSLIMLLIIFFSFVYPILIKKKDTHCASCTVNKENKIKRAFKKYHKKYK